MTTRILDICRRIPRLLGWTQSSYFIMSGFLATLLLIGVVWWPLVETNLAYLDWNRPWWQQVDWLLMGDFMAMSLLIMAGANLRKDVLILFVGLAGGLAIEGWGTQTELWTYFTVERPPLWIIPAWPIAGLSIDRLVRILQGLVPKRPRVLTVLYWLILPVFYALMLVFVWPTMDKSLTIMALIACGLMIATPTDTRSALVTFVAGSGLGYFLELWGTTRYCWTYYTLQTPPLFAVLAHGMAAIAFWRVGLLTQQMLSRLVRAFRPQRPLDQAPSP